MKVSKFNAQIPTMSNRRNQSSNKQHAKNSQPAFGMNIVFTVDKGEKFSKIIQKAFIKNMNINDPSYQPIATSHASRIGGWLKHFAERINAKGISDNSAEVKYCKDNNIEILDDIFKTNFKNRFKKETGTLDGEINGMDFSPNKFIGDYDKLDFPVKIANDSEINPVTNAFGLIFRTANNKISSQSITSVDQANILKRANEVIQQGVTDYVDKLDSAEFNKLVNNFNENIKKAVSVFDESFKPE